MRPLRGLLGPAAGLAGLLPEVFSPLLVDPSRHAPAREAP